MVALRGIESECHICVEKRCLFFQIANGVGEMLMLRRTLRKIGRYLVSVSDDERSRTRYESRVTKQRAWEFSRQVTDLARRHGTLNRLLAGGIELLELRDIREEVGGCGQVGSQALSMMVQRIIEGRLSPKDTYLKQDDENFLLCFASADRTEVRKKLEDITADIRDALHEVGGDTRFEVGHEVVEIDTGDVNDESVVETITESLRKVRREARDASRHWRQHLIRNASVSYWPIWLSHKQVVAIHRAILDDETGQLALRRLACLSSADEMRETLFEIDSLILGRATTDLHALIGEGGRTQLIVPLYYASLEASRRRTRYQEICENIPAAYRRYILFEVHDIPSGTPCSRISEVVSMLNGYGLGVLLEVDMNALSMPSAMGIAGVVSRISDDVLSKHNLVRNLHMFASHARAARLKSFLYKVDSNSLARDAIQAEVDYLQGSAIVKRTQNLKPHYRWDLKWLTCDVDLESTQDPGVMVGSA